MLWKCERWPVRLECYSAWLIVFCRRPILWYGLHEVASNVRSNNITRIVIMHYIRLFYIIDQRTYRKLQFLVLDLAFELLRLCYLAYRPVEVILVDAVAVVFYSEQTTA